jgi:hypothetical protein
MKLKLIFLTLALVALYHSPAFAQKNNKTVKKFQTIQERIDSAVIKSVWYFDNMDYTKAPNVVVMILSLLDREFSLKADIPAYPYLLNNSTDYGQIFFKLYNRSFMNRDTLTLDKDYILSLLSDEKTFMDNIDYRTILSMYCNQYKAPASFVPALYEKAQLGEYELTHVALQIRSLEYNGYCNLKEYTDSINNIKKYCIDRMAANAQVFTKFFNASSPDYTMETIAMLAYLKRYDLIPTEIVPKICDLQLPDGGWPMYHDADKRVSNEHTSILALWALCEIRANYTQLGKLNR